jgi:PmbA protein
MKKNKELLDLVLFAVDHAKRIGSDSAEAYISDTEKCEITISDQNVETFNIYQDTGIGIRIIKDQKLNFGSSNDLSKDSIKELLNNLIKKVKYHTPDQFYTLPSKTSNSLTKDWSTYEDMIAFSEDIASVPVEEKIKDAIKIEKAGLAYSKKVQGSVYGGYQDSSSFNYIANSNGISGMFPNSGAAGYIAFSAVDGDDQQSGSYSEVKIKYKDIDFEKIGKVAAERAVKMLGAKPIESCELPMVISPDLAVQLLGYISGMLSADSVQKGKSLFAKKLGTSVASSIFNLIDDGRYKGGIATSPVDGEGVETQTTPLIVNGVLKSYLHNSYTANKDKVKSTGNAARDNYQSSGSGIGTNNLFLQPGKMKTSDIISGISKGFHLDDAIGLHAGINSTSGDFSLPVAGFMIENGKLAAPVRGITIAGNLFDMLKSIEKIGDDLTWIGSTGSPTLYVKNIMIGGTKKK